MTAPARKSPVRRKPSPKPAGAVAAEVVEAEQDKAVAVAYLGLDWVPTSTPIGHALAVELLAQGAPPVT